jgi:hypothetical protein
MKKLLVTMAVAITGVVQAFALTPTAIRENARFLTDRMAYELNLTPQQYEDCYEINYDFIASINPFMDEVVYGYPEYIDRYYNYLDYRNDDLRYIMTEAQYLAFAALDYFFRPIYTHAGNWLFRVYQYYSNTRFFYYDPPLIYHTYFGGHGRHYFPHGYYGGGRYSHHVYARPRPVHRRGGRHDFGPHASYRPRHYSPHHVPAGPRHERTSPGRNDHHRGNDHGINNRGNDHHGNAGRGNDHGNAGRGNDRGNGGRGNDRGNNGRGNDHGNGSHDGMGQGGNGSHGSHGGASQGGGNGRSNGGGVNRASRTSRTSRTSRVQPSNESRQMRQQSSGRTERVQGNVQRGASNATRAGSASHISGGSHRSSGSSHGGGGSHSGGSRGGSSHGGGSHSGGHRR